MAFAPLPSVAAADVATDQPAPPPALPALAPWPSRLPGGRGRGRGNQPGQHAIRAASGWRLLALAAGVGLIWASLPESSLAAEPGARGLPSSALAPTAALSSLTACLILPSRSADVGSPMAGIVEAVEVERGDSVARGAILIRLQADVERARATVARTRADSEAELRGALAALDLARQRLDRSKALHSDQFLSSQAVDQAEAEHRLAVEKVSQARDSLRVSMGESGVSSAQMAQRLIRAPFAGIVTERFAQPGERFEEKPLLRIAAIDELKAEVVAPSVHFGRIQVGQKASIQPDLPGQPARVAEVTQIDQVLDPASNTFRIRLSLPNPDRSLPAGLRCRVDFAATAEPAGQARPGPLADLSGPAPSKPARPGSGPGGARPGRE